jgi:hypothetical protein
LSQDAALQKNSETDILVLIDELKPLIEQVSPHEGGYSADQILSSAEVLLAELDQNLSDLDEVEELFYGKELAAYGERCATVFKRWDEEGGWPSLLAITMRAWDKFSLPQDKLFKAAILSAIIAEVPNDLQYHGNTHYRKVLLQSIRLAQTNQKLEGEEHVNLSDENIALLLIAAIIHDLGHEGGDNLRDGIYTPGYMEQKAYDIAHPYFEALELERDQCSSLETLVFCTDITFFAGDNSPCVRMRKIYSYYFIDDSDETVLNYMIGKLRRFDDNKEFTLMAMVLHEADIASSAGLTYEQSIRETIDIFEERYLQTAGPKGLLAFMKEQLEGGMKTEAGKAVFSSSMDVIMDQAMQDFQEGKETFYE